LRRHGFAYRKLLESAMAGSSREAPPIRQRWWQEAEAAFLVVLMFAAYFTRAGELPIRGEEPTRAQIAREMVKSNDWLVPREQGEPFRIRPPLQNWLIALGCMAQGSWGVFAVRLPSLIATLLTTLLIYGYSRSFLSRLGALSAAVAFATMVDMFQMGRQAETEALFILLVSGALLTWHWGLIRGWPDFLTYGAGYGFVALAMLTKGIQAPTYFIATVAGYLLLTGQLRRAFCKGHLFGALFGSAIVLAWAIPYGMELGWRGVWDIWMGDPAVHDSWCIRNWRLQAFAKHFATFPLEIAAGTLPWSLMLLIYTRSSFRKAIRELRPQVLYLSISVAVAFVTCWLPPGGQPRFLAPLYPSLAVLIGLGIERCGEAEITTPFREGWRLFVLAMAGLILVAAFAALVLAGIGPNSHHLAPLAEAPVAALAYALVAAGLAFSIFLLRNEVGSIAVRRIVLAMTAFQVMVFTGYLTDVRLRRSEQPAAAMVRLKEQLPPHQQLVSIDGHAVSTFAYLYGDPLIVPGSWPKRDPGSGLTYFCFLWEGGTVRPKLPFAWQEIGFVPLDRNRLPVPERIVIVGQRVSPSEAAGN